MKSLRRDLVDRRLWPLVVVFVAAIVAVPFLLHGHGTDVTIAPPPGASGASSASAGAGAGQSHGTQHAVGTPTSGKRDPFVEAHVTTAGHSGPQRSKASASATKSTATTASGSASTGTSGGSVSSSSSSSSSSSGAGAGSSASTTTATTTPAVTPPVTTTPSTTTGGTSHRGSTQHSWEIYSVDVRVGDPRSPTAHQNIARLMPLPSARAPQVMYMGVSDHGHAAVFALGAGVNVHALRGDRSAGAFCHPTRPDCALVVIPVGKTVGLRYVSATGRDRTLVLRVVRIRSRVTRSSSAVKSARARVSPVGLCDLKLGDPIGFFDPADVNVTIASTAACRKNKLAVPFPGSIGAGSSEQG